ncbi:caspase family protein [Streptomyces lunaelactis]|uniref:VMAP-C domain-containing protein n=1 Tax=Streptomyces lunaelactis TaxID=1535768 RepID=UPI001585303E|nr:caspase family protein [Streptomyces lunaelactis]NUK34081.1 caspase family protein [Streptomyces lunaelactis]NUK40818.1 caspase family protein [Streptomyces lunaelactis]NUK57858.1 caspase family protein [Streptomyces lunaelactis]NUK69427.1 caspase family protein [Streptomyces lunaelactis]NUK80925.1 caspase family protein [Streptomyces lunaelactis]
MTARTSLPDTLRPERTYAFVAGVETYGISTSWNLRGAARDALRFAGWLTGPAGVPHDNIRLLLSPLDPEALDWSGTPGLRELSTAYRPATEANVKEALLDDLPQRDGDFLWIFWAGHGYVTPARRDLVLPCADATPGLIRHLNLDSMLRWWRTDLVRKPRFALQAALVDACRIDAPRDTRWNFGSNDYEGGIGQPWRRQFRLYAAREGEAAKNDRERGAGQFTEALVTELKDRSLPDGVRDLAEIGRAVHARFQQMHERGEGWQLPQFEVERDWNGCSFLDVPGDKQWHTPQAGRLDQKAWDGLGEVFGDRPLPRCTYDAYAWAFKAAGCAAPVQGGLPAGTLIEVAHDLDDRQGGRPDTPLIVPFVRFLAERCGTTDEEWVARLRAWEERTRDRLGVPALPPPPPPPSSTVLHLRLEPAADGDRHLVRMWLCRDTTDAIWESEDRPLTLDEVRDELVRQLSRVAVALGAPSADGDYPAVQRVEFHVPFDLLGTPFDQWQVPRGRGGRRLRPLGVLHEVVVRCPEERDGARTAWHRSWAWLRTQGGRHPAAVRVVDDTEVTDALAVDLGARPEPACMVAHTTGARTEDVLDALLEGGVPVAVWRRDGPLLGSAHEFAALLAPDPTGPAGIDVLSLPGRIRDLRQSGSSGGSADGADRLALLWDDPDRTMDHRSLA